MVTDDDWMMNEIHCRKFRHWSYEREWRAFKTLNVKSRDAGFYFVDFNPSIRLNKVIVGHACEVKRATIERAIGDLPKVKLVKARLGFTTFDVRVQKMDGMLP